MYFPYFRGRQYELLALKELAAKSLISSFVVPVIEPVKIIPALNNSLAAFQAASLPVALVLNGMFPHQMLFLLYSQTKVLRNV